MTAHFNIGCHAALLGYLVNIQILVGLWFEVLRGSSIVVLVGKLETWKSEVIPRDGIVIQGFVLQQR